MSTHSDVTDDEVLLRYPSIPIDHDSKDFWKGCLEKKLLIDRCQNCGYYIHFPRSMCPKCWSDDVQPTQVSGRGTLYSVVFYHQGRGASGALAAPLPIGVIELAEQTGLRLTSTIVNASTEDISIGMPVELTWTDFEDAPVPAFQPAPGPDRAPRTASQGAANRGR
jgi:uncharacterized OB-fold protein